MGDFYKKLYLELILKNGETNHDLKTLSMASLLVTGVDAKS